MITQMTLIGKKTQHKLDTSGFLNWVQNQKFVQNSTTINRLITASSYAWPK